MNKAEQIKSLEDTCHWLSKVILDADGIDADSWCLLCRLVYDLFSFASPDMLTPIMKDDKMVQVVIDDDMFRANDIFNFFSAPVIYDNITEAYPDEYLSKLVDEVCSKSFVYTSLNKKEMRHMPMSCIIPSVRERLQNEPVSLGYVCLLLDFTYQLYQSREKSTDNLVIGQVSKLKTTKELCKLKGTNWYSILSYAGLPEDMLDLTRDVIDQRLTSEVIDEICTTMNSNMFGTLSMLCG